LTKKYRMKFYGINSKNPKTEENLEGNGMSRPV
jgi:hypothetical protein